MFLVLISCFSRLICTAVKSLLKKTLLNLTEFLSVFAFLRTSFTEQVPRLILTGSGFDAVVLIRIVRSTDDDARGQAQGACQIRHGRRGHRRESRHSAKNRPEEGYP